jgi:hypothetical protein
MSAVLSDCGRYRYRLEREVPGMYPGAQSLRPLFIGVNPSTADATVNDQTIRKDIGFCQRWCAGRFYKGNVFGYRATDVTKLAEVEDPVGPENDHYLLQMIDECNLIIPCWGDAKKVPRALRYRFDLVRKLLYEAQKPVRIFGLTKGGDPLHPLMLSYSTTLKEWT